MLYYLVFIGSIAMSVSSFMYLRDTIKGVTQPNRVTWLIWGIGPLIGTIASVSSGVGWSVLPVFISGFWPVLIFLASFLNKKSYWKLKGLDYICGICAISALLLWAITDEPNIAIGLSVLSDVFASIPTLNKLWKYPKSETPWVFIVAAVCNLTSFSAIENWNFSSLAFPIYLVIINTILSFAGYHKSILNLLKR